MIIKEKDLIVISYHLRQHVENRMLTSRTKITDLVLEEVFVNALRDAGYNVIYIPGSHNSGCDIFGDITISSKSGVIVKNTLVFSSFRLSRYDNNLSAMLDFIDGDGKNFEFYFILARDEFKPGKRQLKKDSTLVPTITYKFYIIPADIFTAKKMTWTQISNGWKTTMLSDIAGAIVSTCLRIYKKMSNQLWIELDLESIKNCLKFEISMPVSELAKSRFISK